MKLAKTGNYLVVSGMTEAQYYKILRLLKGEPGVTFHSGWKAFMIPARIRTYEKLLLVKDLIVDPRLVEDVAFVRRERADLPVAYNMVEKLRGCETFNFKGYEFKRTPWHHQLRGVKLVANCKCLALLWDMRTGKTFTIVNAVQYLKYIGQPHKTLVICPKHIRTTWVEETQKYTDLKCLILGNGTQAQLRALSCNDRITMVDGPKVITKPGTPDIYITNTDGVRNKLLCKALAESKFNIAVVDESHCVSRGSSISTVHGDRPIETVRTGDIVHNAFGAGRVLATFHRKVNSVVALRLSNGTEIVCTPEHRFFTTCGWQYARDMLSGSKLYSMSATGRLLREHTDVQAMRNSDSSSERWKKEELLFAALRDEMALGSAKLEESHGGENPKDHRRETLDCPSKQPAHDQEEPDDVRCNEREDEQNSQGHGTQTLDPGRQWPGSDQVRTDRSGFDRGPDKLCCSDWGAGKKVWSTLPLQDRRGSPETENSHRSGWRESSISSAKGTGQEKGNGSETVRVESVSFYERGDTLRPGYSDSYFEVYNLEVEGHPSYFVSGCLSHNCFGNKSKRTKGLMEIKKRVERRYILTGTLIARDPTNAYNQMRFVNSAMFPETLEEFKRRYCIYRSHGDVEIFVRANPKTKAELWARIDKLSDKVRIEDCHDMPEKLYSTIHVDMTPEQAKAHADLIEQLCTELEGDCIATTTLLRSRKLTQITSGFIYNEEKIATRFKGNPKLDALQDILGQVVREDRKVIVWAYFHETIKMIQELLVKEDIEHSIISGSDKTMTDAERHKRVWEFQHKSAPVIVANPSMLGLGIDLSAAKYSVFFENDFRLDYRLQAEARNYGDKANALHGGRIVIYDLSASNSVDDLVLKSIGCKKNFHEFINAKLLRELRGTH